jgi:hypothetical protein
MRATIAADKRFRAAQLRARKAHRARLSRDWRLNVNQRGALYRSFVRRQNLQYRFKVRALDALKRRQGAALVALRRCGQG